MSLPFETTVDEDRAVISPSGDLDLSSAPALERAIERVIHRDSGTVTTVSVPCGSSTRPGCVWC